MGLEARVRVDLDQTEVQVVVKHEIEAKPFEPIVIRSDLADQLGTGRFECVAHSILDLWQYALVKAHLFLSEEKLVKVGVAEFVARLKLSVIL